MRRFIVFLTFAVLAVLPSCRQETKGGRDTIPYVKAVVSDTEGVAYKLLSGMSRVPSSGDIYILGSEAPVKLIGSKYAECDVPPSRPSAA